MVPPYDALREHSTGMRDGAGMLDSAGTAWLPRVGVVIGPREPAYLRTVLVR